MGALGRVWGNGDLELALTIRTFAIAEGRIHLWVGGGVVWDSDPAAEVEESLDEGPAAARGDRRAAPARRRSRDPARARRQRPRARRPAEPVLAPTTRRSCAAARRSRPCASTAAGRSGSRRTSSGSPARRRRSGCRRSTRALERSSGLALPRAAECRTPSCGSSGRPARLRRAASALALVTPIPDQIEQLRATWAAGRHAARRAGRGPWLLPGREVDELRRQHGRRGRGPRRGADDAVFVDGARHRARGAGHERLVAAGRDALHAVARPRHPRRASRGRRDRARPRPLGRRRGARSRRRRPARRRRGVHVVVGARADADRGARRRSDADRRRS